MHKRLKRAILLGAGVLQPALMECGIFFEEISLVSKPDFGSDQEIDFGEKSCQVKALGLIYSKIE